MSALGCVMRTVLTSGSSTGLTLPTRAGPSLASLRRTAAAPDAPSGGAWPELAGSAGCAALRAARPDPERPCDLLPLPPARPWPPCCSRSAGGSAGMPAADVTPSSAAGRSWVTSAAAAPAVTTSPATCAPHVASHREQGAHFQAGQLRPAGQETELEQHHDAG